MSLATMNTDSINMLLPIISVVDAWRFGKASPVHQEAVNSYLRQTRSININKILSRDGEVLLKVLKQCENLKELIFTKEKTADVFSKIPSLIARHCRELKILDISGIKVTREDIRLLSSSLTCLKSLSIRFNHESTVLVEKLLQNNPQLEKVRLCGPINNTCYKILPKNLKCIDFGVSYFPVNCNAFLCNVGSWKLEKLLLLSTPLSKKDILQLSRTQTTLKSLSLRFGTVDNALDTLFCNNPGLEDVLLFSVVKNTIGTCLRHLTPSLKHLKIIGGWMLGDNDFVEYVRSWQLQSLHLNVTHKNNEAFLRRVIEAAPLLRNLTTNIGLFSWKFRNFYTELSQLKVLDLRCIYNEDEQMLRFILQKSVNLEVLDLGELHFKKYQDTLALIAKLPKLREFSLVYCIFATSKDYDNLMCDLGRCPSLTTVRFYNCKCLNDESALVLVRNCKLLTNLLIITPNITIKLVNDIVRELDTQKERKSILHLGLLGNNISEKDVSSSNLHQLLQLEIFRDL